MPTPMFRRLALHRWRLLMLLGAITVSPAGCNSDTFLAIEDPDIINPSNVQSSAGANAVRLGALARLNSATSGGESLLLLGGLFTDEWLNGDSFIGRQEVDQRTITVQNSFVTDASRALHRARLAAQQALELLEEFNPTAPAWQPAEMYFVQAYIENIAAEHFCNGLVFSSVIDGVEMYGSPMMVAEAFTRALAHADSGLALVTGTTTDDNRVRNALRCSAVASCSIWIARQTRRRRSMACRRASPTTCSTHRPRPATRSGTSTTWLGATASEAGKERMASTSRPLQTRDFRCARAVTRSAAPMA
jgi:hypothetical protein